MRVIYYNLNKITKFEMQCTRIWKYNRYLDFMKIVIDKDNKIKLLLDNEVIATGVKDIKRTLKNRNMKIEKKVIWD